MKVNFKNIILLIVIVALMIVGVSIFNGITKQQDEIVYGEIASYFDKNLITSIKIDENNLVTGTRYNLVTNNDGSMAIEVDKNGKPVETEFKFQLAWTFQAEAIDTLAQNEIKEGNLSPENYDIKAPKQTPWYVAYLPYIVIILVFIGLWIFVLRSSSAPATSANFTAFLSPVIIFAFDFAKEFILPAPPFAFEERRTNIQRPMNTRIMIM